MDLVTQIWNALFPPTPEKIAALVGAMGPWFYVLLFAVIFCETGLVVTPWLPGDSLLFAAGAFAAGPESPISLPLMIVLLISAAVIGDTVNYTIGYHLGPKVFKYERSWFFNKKHLAKAQAFYEKYGSKTLILARFVPIVRTFAPFVAGVGRMPYRRFVVFSVSGAVAWVLICVLSGYLFGGLPWVREGSHFEMVVVAIVLISVLPMAVELVLSWRRKRMSQLQAPKLAAKEVDHFAATANPVQAGAGVPR
jgi:membrane-associated protein